ncbi:MAG: Gfo/Idh/MocA family oxidoreductase, partial [Ardenticatenia bacterium]|nr:Gfo/Idh/MocA family oxidoreductase [Ardenticatenia bacterium]
MKKIGFGVIGTGIVGGAWHAYVYGRLPQSKLAAVCDLDEQRANAAAQEYGPCAVYTDYRQLLGNPEVAAASNATPDQPHREIALAAAEAGTH